MYYQWQSQWADGYGVGNQGSWSPTSGSSENWANTSDAGFKAKMQSYSDAEGGSWTGGSSSDPFAQIGFPDVDAPRFKS